MYYLSKKGDISNRPTNEYICESVEDLNKIPQEEITLGTTAIILDGSLEVYMANSQKEWIQL